MRVLVTGAAGFIGYHVASRLLHDGHEVAGVDNLNNYYDVALKEARLNELRGHTGFTFHKINIADRTAMLALADGAFTHIIHLAAQAGVRYSLQNPYAYVESNLMGQVVVMELAHKLPNLQHLVFASSSSVYGANAKLPFAIEDAVETPLSLYAATKRADELMAHTYAHLYRIPMTALRFFTVYGPWGRPDMATYLFARNIMAGQPIKIFNNGQMKRDFTYIDDIVQGVVAVVAKPPKDGGADKPPLRLYNLGNSRSEKLMDFVAVLEKSLGKKAVCEFEPMQPGDVPETYADITDSMRDFGFVPTTTIEMGIPKFVQWFKKYHNYQ